METHAFLLHAFIFLHTNFFLRKKIMDPSTADRIHRFHLHNASKKGDLDSCRFLISQGVNVNRFDSTEYAPLHYAAQGGYEDICELLISSGADVDRFGTSFNEGTPLYFAAKEGHLEVCRILISSGANVNHRAFVEEWTPLYIAWKGGHKEVCRLLLSSGAKFRGPRPRVDNLTGLCNMKIEVERMKQRIFMNLLCERTFATESFFYKDKLPLDLFKLILKEAMVPFTFPKRNGVSKRSKSCSIV